jgi:GNAT superfamily N-acetyltransferase
MELRIVDGSQRELPGVLEWLREEDANTSEGFFCNSDVIARSFRDGSSLCALADAHVVAFAVYYIAPPSSGISIIEVHPKYRKRGVGAQMMTATIQRLRSLGAEYVHANCTSTEGEALCRAHGFQTYIHPRNFRSEFATPELRLALTQSAPPPQNNTW